MAGQQKQRMSLVGGNPTAMPAIEFPTSSKQRRKTLGLSGLDSYQQSSRTNAYVKSLTRVPSFGMR